MKKRILTVALVVALLATCFGGTLAYLKDTDAVKNTFTTGNVYIELDEALVKKADNGDLVADGTTRVTEQTYKLFPGMEVTKDPTIHIEAGSEDAWIAAKITITGNLAELKIGDKALVGADGKLNVDTLISGGLLGTKTGCTIEQVVDTSTWTIYLYVDTAYAQSAGKTDILLFDKLTIPASWDNAEMTAINNMMIDVQAYATQAYGFATCEAAMKAAFPAAFN